MTDILASSLRAYTGRIAIAVILLLVLFGALCVAAAYQTYRHERRIALEAGGEWLGAGCWWPAWWQGHG